MLLWFFALYILEREAKHPGPFNCWLKRKFNCFLTLTNLIWKLFDRSRCHKRTSYILQKSISKVHFATSRPSIKDVGKFSRFLTPIPLRWQFFYYYYPSANLTNIWPLPPKKCQRLKWMVPSFNDISKVHFHHIILIILHFWQINSRKTY